MMMGIEEIPVIYNYFRREIMSNGLNKFIAVLSVAAMAVSIAPAVFAADDVNEISEASNEMQVQAATPDADGIYYDEDFSDFGSGQLIDMHEGNNTKEFPEKGMSIACRTRNGSEASHGISADGDTLSLFANGYIANNNQPRISLDWTSGAKFANDRVMNIDIKFTNTSSAVLIKDSAGTSITINIPDGVSSNDWVSYTIASKADSTDIVAVKTDDGSILNYTQSSTVLKDFELITATNANFSYMIDNLKIADIEYVLPDSVILGSALASMSIAEGQPGMTVEDGVYVIKRSITIPEAPSGTTLEWTIEQSADGGETWTETSLVRVSDKTLRISPSSTSANYLVRLTANITAGELSDSSKQFLFRVKELDEGEVIDLYNEDFSDFSGTLADLSEALSNNTSYEASKGITFTAEYRSAGNSGISLVITDGAVDFEMSSNINEGRKPKIMLSRTMSDTNFTKSVFLEMDIQIPDEGRYFLVQDSNSNEVQIGVPKAYYGKRVHVKIIPAAKGSYIVITDTDGKVVDVSLSGSTLKNVSMITVNAISMSKMMLDNLRIADISASVSADDFVAAGLNNLDITDLVNSSGIYNAVTDFSLPSNPLGTTVTWQAMQKEKAGGDWKPSTFITVAGTKATINPTSDIANYDVKLVATISAGEAAKQKEFIVSLPNPIDEITGIMSNNLNIVNTTDKDSKDAVITFDLKGTDVLNRDLKLPISYAAYSNTKLTWTSSDEDHIKIADDGTAAIMTSDKSVCDVTLTAVATYKKGDIEYKSEPQVYNVKVGYAEDMDGKYKVRFDAAYADNFKDIPSSATSNITLPSKGYFGSDITWNSSVPTVISNQGSVTRASTTKNVIMTATLVSGDAKEEKKFEITVPGKGSSGGGGGGGTSSSTGKKNPVSGSGGIATSTNIVSIPTTTNGEQITNKLLEEAAQSTDKFTDVKDAAWARTEINALADKGIINGVSDTSFAPNDTVTRAQFAKMLMGAFNLTADAYTTSSFKDVSADAWYFAAVETAYNLGVINGVEDGVFAPNALITRQDMAVMVTRAAKAAGVAIAETTESKVFADAASIGDYAKEAVDVLVKGGIINGMTDTEFAPTNNATRAQAAKILYNFAK